MSLENKISSLRHPNRSTVNSGKNPFKMGTVYRNQSNALDIEKTAIPVDSISKGMINKTIPVEDLPQEVIAESIPIDTPIVEKFSEQEPKSVVIEKKVEPVVKNIQLNSTGSNNQIAYSKK
jgi:hypothetical protein